MSEVLNVELRQARGTRHCRRMRAAGSVPAVLYGHGEAVVHLAVPSDDLEAAVRHGQRVVRLEGGVREQAVIRELQWDVWGSRVLHVDFNRVSAQERIEVTLPIEIRGEAPGIKDGGIVEQLIHDVTIECQVTAIPEKIEVNINHLGIDGEITLADLALPPGATIVGRESEEVAVHCIVPAAIEVAEEEEEGVEPEVIGRKEVEEGGEEE